MSQPLHVRISADLAAKIRSGEWPPGHRIPFEHELTARYGCARATVSKAVEALAAAGLVDRRRRAGSFVAQPHVEAAILEIADIQAEVEARGQAYGYELLSRRLRPPRAEGDEGRLKARGPALQIICRHRANGRPFAVEERVINLAAAPSAERADFAVTAPGAWLLAHVAWSEAEHRISALGADPVLAGLLAVAPGHACLRLTRWTWRGGEGITAMRQTFPGEAYNLVARFTPAAFENDAAKTAI